MLIKESQQDDIIGYKCQDRMSIENSTVNTLVE